jgi:2-polyprenyl-6-methoxyphenol hydroxylase-like FAD-dependent oxidoreductase
VARSRTIIVAGAGIGGLTAALALIRAGFRVVVIEQAERLEETGAGIQLSPNATRILLSLGAGDHLRHRAVAPEAIRVMRAKSAREIVRIPLGRAAELRYGAPYWVIHRADLQAGLIETLETTSDFVLRLGSKVEDYAVHAHGITVQARGGFAAVDEHGIALIGADGLWSTVRGKLGDRAPRRFRDRTAWRALIPADRLPPQAREAATALWLGPDAHLVHYPVSGGAPICSRAFPAGTRMCARSSPRRRRGSAGRSTIGCCRIRGASAPLPYWATPPTRCCRFSRKAAPWRSRTPRCSPPAWRDIRRILPRAYAATKGCAGAAPRARNATRAATAASIISRARRPSRATSR